MQRIICPQLVIHTARYLYSGGNYVGGLVGRNAYNTGATIDNCYSNGSVSAAQNPGGLCGFNYVDADITNSFWDTQTSGQASSDGGTGKTTAEMKTQSTFTDAGWDFATENTNGTNSYWDLDGTNNSGYLFFNWQSFVAPLSQLLRCKILFFQTLEVPLLLPVGQTAMATDEQFLPNRQIVAQPPLLITPHIKQIVLVMVLKDNIIIFN